MAWFESVLHVGAQQTDLAIPGGLFLILIGLLLPKTRGPKSRNLTKAAGPSEKSGSGLEPKPVGEQEN